MAQYLPQRPCIMQRRIGALSARRRHTVHRIAQHRHPGVSVPRDLLVGVRARHPQHGRLLLRLLLEQHLHPWMPLRREARQDLGRGGPLRG